MSAFLLPEWEKKTEPYHLTIGDVYELKEGKSIHFYCLDRNWTEMVSFNNGDDVEYKASDVLQNNYRAIFYKDYGIRGETKWFFNDGTFRIENTVWHVDLGHIWCPLDEDDKVPLFLECFDVGKLAGVKAEHLPLNTKIGWRGPCILKENLNKVGLIKKS